VKPGGAQWEGVDVSAILDPQASEELPARATVARSFTAEFLRWAALPISPERSFRDQYGRFAISLLRVLDTLPRAGCRGRSPHEPGTSMHGLVHRPIRARF
jgi:hypothetical protein